MREQLELARKLDHPKRVTILVAIGISWMSVSAIRSFFVGPPFFFSSGVRAASDNGFFCVLMFVSAIQWLYASWAILRNDSDQSPQDPAVRVNHGQ
jgi:hypothetical protein